MTGETEARESGITTVVRKEDGSILENVKEISAGNSYSIAVTKERKSLYMGLK